MKLFAVVLLVVLVAGGTHAAPPQTEQAFLALPKAQQEAEAPSVLKLAATSGDIWALGGIGIARTHPLKFLAYEALLRRRDAAELFTGLLKDSNLYTQLYALKGLSTCAPETFRKIAPDYLDRKELVLEGQGCILSVAPFGDIVDRMQWPSVRTPLVVKSAKESKAP